MNNTATKKILIVEDEVLVAVDLKEFLDSLGYEVQLAHTASEALEKVKLFNPHLAICDINLGKGANGIELVTDLSKLQNCPAIIYATAFSNSSYINKATELGALNYIVKPWNEQQIKVTVEIAFTQIGLKVQTKSMLSLLSHTEYKILELIAQQKTSKEIANILFIAEKTVRNHRYNIVKKMDLKEDKNSLLKWAISNINSDSAASC